MFRGRMSLAEIRCHPVGAVRTVAPVISYQWRGDFATAEVETLHADGFGRTPGEHDWKAQLERHSLGWVCARRGAALAGFVNVAWDGGAHAFLLDTAVARPLRRHGIGTGLVKAAAREAREAGCEWLHADFEDHLGPFYFGCCGFRPTNAGLIRLDDPPGPANPVRRVQSRE
jgi:GNAT superfamily N-acetyltransferase